MARRETEEPEELEPQTFTVPLLWTLYSSLVIVVVVAILNSDIGQDLEDELQAPARTLIAAPVIVAGIVVFVASMVALIAPRYRRPALRVSEIAGWVIPAWLVMCAMAVGAISFAIHHAG